MDEQETLFKCWKTIEDQFICLKNPVYVHTCILLFILGAKINILELSIFGAFIKSEYFLLNLGGNIDYKKRTYVQVSDLIREVDEKLL